MTADGSNPRGPTPTPLAPSFLWIGGVVSVIAGLVNALGGHSEREAVAGTGCLIFAGLCSVAAALLCVASHLQRND
jgi:hypothetical protein